MTAAQVPVVVEDVGVDAAVARRVDGTRIARILRPGQSFESAVRALLAADEALHPDEARAIVRRSMPEATTLMAELMPPVPSRRRSRPRRPATVRRLIAVSVAAAATTACIGVGWWALDMSHRSPRQAPAITVLARHAGLDCVPLGVGTSRCINRASRDLMLACAHPPVEKDAATVSLEWGTDKVLVSRHRDEAAAAAYEAGAGNEQLFPGLVREGRWTVWGTDSGTVRHIARELRLSTMGP